MTVYIPLDWIFNTELWAVWLTWGTVSMTLVYLTGVAYISKVNNAHVTRGRKHHHIPTSSLISPVRTLLMVLGGPITAILIPFGIYGVVTAEKMYVKREEEHEKMVDRLINQTQRRE